MADADKTLITRAEFTSAKNATSLGKTLTIDGDTIQVGDTGRRDVTALMNMQWLDAGRIVFRRQGNKVDFWLIGLLVKAGAPSSITIFTNDRTGMSPINPPYIAGDPVFPGTGNVSGLTGPVAFASVNTSHGIAVHGVQPGLTYNGHLDWETSNAWWSGALPGVADGETAGV